MTATVSLAPAPTQPHIVYSITPLPAEAGTIGTSQVELKVHVAHGHHYLNKSWNEPITPDMARLFAEMDKAAAELESQLG